LVTTSTVIRVNYYGESGFSAIDVDSNTYATTSEIGFTIERATPLPNETIMVIPEIWGAECDDPEDSACSWESIYVGDPITIYGSSTGVTMWDVGFPPEFEAFLSSASSTEQSDEIDSFMDIFRYIFPLNIAFDAWDIFYDVRMNTENVEVMDVNLTDLVSDEYDSVVSTSSLTDVAKVDSAMPLWNSKIYPLFESLVYILNFLFIIFFLFIYKTDKE